MSLANNNSFLPHKKLLTVFSIQGLIFDIKYLIKKEALFSLMV